MTPIAPNLIPEHMAAFITPGAPLPSTPQERAAYEAIFHEHEEDNVPQSPEHNDAADDIEDVLDEYVTHLWVCREVACYWDRSDPSTYLGPDVMACDLPGPAAGQRSYRNWEHGRFRLAVEIASDSSETYDQEFKPDRYAAGLRPEEIVYFDPETAVLRWWVFNGASYNEIGPQANGRFWSTTTGLWFGLEGKRLRIYDREGQALGNYSEQRARADREHAARLRETRRADREQSRREQSEAATAEEARRRTEAEAREAEEARRRTEAEVREAEEARRRAEAEAREAEEARRRTEAEAREAAARAQLEAERAEWQRRLSDLQARLAGQPEADT
jgi:hypothetical protein